MNKLWFGNIRSPKLSIQYISIIGILLSIQIILGWITSELIPLNASVKVGFDFAFMIMYGLFFGAIFGPMVALIADNLKSLIYLGYSFWMWQYGIILPVFIPFITALYKYFVWDTKRNWIIAIIIIFVLIDLIAFGFLLGNYFFNNKGYSKVSKAQMIISWISWVVMLIMQSSSLLIYWVLIKKHKDNKRMRDRIRKYMNIITVVIVILVLFSWLWGVYSVYAYFKHYFGLNKAFGDVYWIYLIPRIAKAPFEGLIWTVFIAGVYELIDFTIIKISKSRW